MAKKTILVRVPTSEGSSYYRRAGLAFARGGDNVVEVTDEQLAILEADKNIAVGEPPKPKPAEKPAEKK
jgi:hypothetical protein